MECPLQLPTLLTPKKTKRVLVAMSGGVDSSVTAALLKRQGYEVIGVTFRLWAGNEGQEHAKACCGIDSVEDARRVAQLLGIPHYVLNLTDAFARTVVADFINEYASGRTPNPCVRCNEFIKYRLFLRKALELDADYIATGHYARIVKNGRYRLLKALDAQKDQSYVLYMLTQPVLARTLLPLGDYRKVETRALARQWGLPVAAKPDSQEICFVDGDDYREFLRRQRPDLVRPGPIVTEDGEIVGTHIGVAFYTVGQRRGLGVTSRDGEPWYVVRIDAATNTLVVGKRASLQVRAAVVDAVNWVGGEPPAAPMRAHVRHRYRAPDALAWVEPLHQQRVRVVWDEPQWAVTPGQIAVFYDAVTGEEVLGGGTIVATTNQAP
ncbi:tRNA-specific 2-thiouridylase MnmA [bacterium HR17]|uniref:tRNA-specific 2-thiouridylase MnmA n=1 Tax=Candidatus Fervidibacter japonicus TaxID=2035412 RepID=A0A2H5XBJ8_9BACT|nr:tRNA-specific 2-thiouridylase MnmA [bacterium HR17]